MIWLNDSDAEKDPSLYSDLPISGSEKKKNIYAVYSALRNLLYTSPKERLFNPEVYIDVEPYLFEIMDEETAFGILGIINDGIKINEPRVILVLSESSVIPDYEEHRYRVTLRFKVKGLEQDVFTFISFLNFKGELR